MGSDRISDGSKFEFNFFSKVIFTSLEQGDQRISYKVGYDNSIPISMENRN